MDLFLLSLGRNRFELYSEPPEEEPDAPTRSDGRLRRWALNAQIRWRELVETARQGRATGRFARWRDQAVCHVAERIAEQRTLWSLIGCETAHLRYPSNMDEDAVRDTLTRVVAAARRRHGWWLVIDLIVFVISGVLALIPGPNLVAYYCAFRVVGHLQSWRGARGAGQIAWTYSSDTSLAELAELAEQPRETRRPQVAEIAARLHLQRLPKFFERVAV
jgi:hypothetical protein